MRIEEFLKQAGVDFVKHSHEAAYTAQEVAAAEHVTGDAVAKPVVVRADDRTVMCVLPASHKIDLAKLAKVLKAKRCRLVQESEMAGLFADVEVGAEPPFGQEYGLDTIVDQRLAGSDTITFSAGTHRECIQMKYADYADLAGAQTADFAVHL